MRTTYFIGGRCSCSLTAFQLLVDLVEHVAVIDQIGAALDLHRDLALRVVDADGHARVVLQVLPRLVAEHVGEVQVLVVEQRAAALDGDVGHAVAGPTVATHTLWPPASRSWSSLGMSVIAASLSCRG